MDKPEITMNDVDRAVLEEFGVEPTHASVVWERMESYCVEQGISFEFMCEMADRLTEGVQIMQGLGTDPLTSFLSAFKNAFLLGWIAHKVLGNGETES